MLGNYRVTQHPNTWEDPDVLGNYQVTLDPNTWEDPEVLGNYCVTQHLNTEECIPKCWESIMENSILKLRNIPK